MLQKNGIVLVDCTSTVYSNLKTGIQRVVRKVAAEALNYPTDRIVLTPVVEFEHRSENISFYRLDQNEIAGKQLPYYLSRTIKFRQKYKKYGEKKKRTLGTTRRVIYFSLYLFFVALSKVLMNRAQRLICLDEAEALLMIDAAWAYNTEWLESLPPRLKLITVVYDMLPVTHPHFSAEAHVSAFKRNFLPILKRSDLLISISEFTMHELQRLEYRQAKAYFHLGCDIAPTVEDDAPPIEAKYLEPFNSGQKAFLSVGTVEPRKGYDLLVPAFEELWSQGFDGNLVIVGKLGWKCEEIVSRINNSIYLNKKLFWFKNAGDAELAFCYKQAHALIFASYFEGFGLPLVEALNLGLPVLASDIPVFREIGGGHVQYFQLTNEALIKAINTFSHANGKAALQTYRALTWQASAKSLLDKVSSFLLPATRI